MIAKLFSRSRLHEHADPAQRVAGIAELPPNSDDLTQLLLSDPAAEVRAAAAARCNDLAALATAWQTESAEPVRAALVAALATALSTTEDAGGARALIDSDHCTDAIR